MLALRNRDLTQVLWGFVASVLNGSATLLAAKSRVRAVSGLAALVLIRVLSGWNVSTFVAALEMTFVRRV